MPKLLKSCVIATSLVLATNAFASETTNMETSSPAVEETKVPVTAEENKTLVTSEDNKTAVTAEEQAKHNEEHKKKHKHHHNHKHKHKKKHKHKEAKKVISEIQSHTENKELPSAAPAKGNAPAGTVTDIK